MGGSSGGTTTGAAAQPAYSPTEPTPQFSTIDFAKQFAPMATSLADFAKTNHYTPQNLMQAYVQGSQPTQTFADYKSAIAAAQPQLQPRNGFGFGNNQDYSMGANRNITGLLGNNFKIGNN